MLKNTLFLQLQSHKRKIISSVSTNENVTWYPIHKLSIYATKMWILYPLYSVLFISRILDFFALQLFKFMYQLKKVNRMLNIPFIIYLIVKCADNMDI